MSGEGQFRVSKVTAFLEDEERELVASQVGNSPDITSVNRYGNRGTLIFRCYKNLCPSGIMRYLEQLHSMERVDRAAWLVS